MSCSDMTIAKDAGATGRFAFFSRPNGDTLHTISIVSTSVLKPDVWTRLVDDFAKAMLGFKMPKRFFQHQHKCQPRFRF